LDSAWVGRRSGLSQRHLLFLLSFPLPLSLSFAGRRPEEVRATEV